MNNQKLSNIDMCMADAMPFNQHHEVRTTIDLKANLGSPMFQNLQGRLQAGDQIVVCQFETVAYERLMAIATVRVVSSNEKGIEIVPLGDIVQVKRQQEKLPVFDYKPMYSVKKEFQGGFIVVDEKGNEYEHFQKKSTARQWIDDVTRET